MTHRIYDVSTTKQIAANRLNAEKSTGPKTVEGKTISAHNATKLGIFSREIVLPDEDLAELQMLGRAIRADLKPSGPVELALAEIVISALWRLRRVLKIETGLFEMYRRYKGVDGGPPVAFAHDASQMDCFWRVERMETTLERRLYKALAELARVQSSRRVKNNDDAIEIDAVTTPLLSWVHLRVPIGLTMTLLFAESLRRYRRPHLHREEVSCGKHRKVTP